MDQLLHLRASHVRLGNLSRYITPRMCYYPRVQMNDTCKVIQTQTMKAIPRLQQNSQMASSTTRRYRISCHGRLADTSRPKASCYDLFNGQRIEVYDPCSNFTQFPRLSLPLSHTGGGKMHEAGYRSCISF